MAVKVLIKRKIKGNALKEVTRLLLKTRYDAMGQEGYISSETLSDIETPNKVVVVSMWQTSGDWLSWKNSPVRSENEAEFEKYLEAPTEIEIYALGLPNA
jgi:heme-degrading monooxygenase HmoA